uniref:protein DPCD isoform X1 n=1 Tax=Myxine glutinosa TaxID=7769 RepID=UPI00358FBFE9
MAGKWIAALREAKKSAITQDGRRKIHFTFADGKEMVEEYHLTSEDLLQGAADGGNVELDLGDGVKLEGVKTFCCFGDMLNGEVRKWRERTTLGAPGHWEVEMGNAALTEEDHPDGHLKENINMPECIRMDTRNAFQWRIRNLPYPHDVYSLAVDPERQRCIIKTTNKKYYKTLMVPDMERYGLPLESSALNFTHKNNTLVITYKKPAAIIEAEHQLRLEIRKLKDLEGSDDCSTQ